jgi:hypothetical protein
MAMRREVFEQTGGFDPGLIMWGNGEQELCYRLWTLGYECQIAPHARVAHLFRSKFPYAVSAVDVLHNLLRTPIIHFDRDRLAAVLAALGKNPVFPRAMALVLDSDVWSRRADLQSRRILDDQAYFDRFPTPGLSGELATASEAAMSGGTVDPSIMIPTVYASVPPTIKYTPTRQPPPVGPPTPTKTPIVVPTYRPTIIPPQPIPSGQP